MPDISEFEVALADEIAAWQQAFDQVVSLCRDAFVEIERRGSTEWNHQAELLFGWSRARSWVGR